MEQKDIHILIDGFVFQLVKIIYTIHACEKLKKGESAECAFSVEREIFKFNEKIMKEVLGKLEGINNEPPNELIIEDCKATFGPKIIIYPSFAATITELKDKLIHMKKKL